MSFRCDYFNRGDCRSCTELTLPDKDRATLKHARLVAEARKKLGAASLTIDPLWQPTRIEGSRTKAKLSVSGSLKKPVIGLVDRERQTTELLACPLHDPRLNEVLAVVKRLITEHGLAPYHIERRQGELKGLILKSTARGEDVLVRFVLRSHDALPRVKRAARELVAALSYVRVVSANIQPLPAALLEGEEEIVFTDESIIWDHFGGVAVAFAPQSFSQVTHETAEALYAHVAGLAREHGVRSWLDLYCGVGGFSLVAARTLEWARGVELSPRAIECARLAAARTGHANLVFETGDVDAWLASYTGPAPDAVLVNPPRRGLSGSIVAAITKLSPARIFYSSCNADTLLRDVAALATAYRLERLSPFDMFPLTEHLEVVAHLSTRLN